MLLAGQYADAYQLRGECREVYQQLLVRIGVDDKDIGLGLLQDLSHSLEGIKRLAS